MVTCGLNPACQSCMFGPLSISTSNRETVFIWSLEISLLLMVTKKNNWELLIYNPKDPKFDQKVKRFSDMWEIVYNSSKLIKLCEKDTFLALCHQNTATFTNIICHQKNIYFCRWASGWWHSYLTFICEWSKTPFIPIQNLLRPKKKKKVCHSFPRA